VVLANLHLGRGPPSGSAPAQTGERSEVLAARSSAAEAARAVSVRSIVRCSLRVHSSQRRNAEALEGWTPNGA
jgi:hypothetical protein